jgi:hypothetical protein
MDKKPIGRPKKMDAEKLITLQFSVKKKHYKMVEKLISDLIKPYRQ